MDGVKYTYELARSWGEQSHPQASMYRHQAFANVVTFALLRRPYSPGPYSLREHMGFQEVIASHIPYHYLEGFEIYDRLAPQMYGPLQEEHYQLWQRLYGTTEGDDEEDLATLTTRTQEHQHEQDAHHQEPLPDLKTMDQALNHLLDSIRQSVAQVVDFKIHVRGLRRIEQHYDDVIGLIRDWMLLSQVPAEVKEEQHAQLMVRSQTLLKLTSEHKSSEWYTVE